MSKVTLQIISDWLNGKGIMSVLTNNFDVPWSGTIDGQVLDDDYYGNRSGNKIVAPLVGKFLSEEGISDTNMLRLARVIYAKYGENWQRTFDALAEEYNPIENYNGIENTKVKYGKRKITNNKGEQENGEDYGEYTNTTGEQKNTLEDKAHTDDIEHGLQHSTNKKQIEGFNSSDFSDADKDIFDSDTYTDKNKYGLHETDNTLGEREDTFGRRQNTFTEGSREDTEEHDAYTDETLYSRHGNLGVTSTQSMLTQELNFRQLYSLMDSVVFPDVDKVMCLSIFGCPDLTMDDFTIVTEYILPKASATILGGVKIGNGITISADGTISVDVSSYVTTEQLTETLQNYVTAFDLETILAEYPNNTALATALSNYYTKSEINTTLESYATKTEVTNGLATKQNTLVSGENIKTINGVSILGEGDLELQGGSTLVRLSASNINANSVMGVNINWEVEQ